MCMNLYSIRISFRINISRVQAITSYNSDKLISPCNFNCSCRIDTFIPVCGSDNIVYANPCYAGCSAKYSNQVSESHGYSKFSDENEENER